MPSRNVTAVSKSYVGPRKKSLDKAFDEYRPKKKAKPGSSSSGIGTYPAAKGRKSKSKAGPRGSIPNWLA